MDSAQQFTADQNVPLTGFLHVQEMSTDTTSPDENRRDALERARQHYLKLGLAVEANRATDALIASYEERLVQLKNAQRFVLLRDLLRLKAGSTVIWAAEKMRIPAVIQSYDEEAMRIAIKPYGREIISVEPAVVHPVQHFSD